MYWKQIEATDTGMVIARVYRGLAGDKTKGRVGLKFVDGIVPFCVPRIVKKRLERAHKWADDYIKVCEEGEHNAAP